MGNLEGNYTKDLHKMLSKAPTSHKGRYAPFIIEVIDEVGVRQKRALWASTAFDAHAQVIAMNKKDWIQGIFTIDKDSEAWHHWLKS